MRAALASSFADRIARLDAENGSDELTSMHLAP